MPTPEQRYAFLCCSEGAFHFEVLFHSQGKLKIGAKRARVCFANLSKSYRTGNPTTTLGLEYGSNGRNHQESFGTATIRLLKSVASVVSFLSVHAGVYGVTTVNPTRPVATELGAS